MSAIQLNFSLRTSGNVKTVHLLGSWDNYTSQLPLSKDVSANKSGAWKSTFRFPSTTLVQGQRYWYYYILDGYHVSHDPARESVVEPTTRRSLNILDIPRSTAAPSVQVVAPATARATRQSQRLSLQVPKGRPLPASCIVSPKPYKPGQVKQICTEQFAAQTMESLARSFAQQRLSVASISSSASVSSDDDEEEEEEEEEDDESDSDADSDVPSLTSSRSSRSNSPCSPTSSVSSTGSRCECERYGITRGGAKVRLDCGGKKCGYGIEEESECESEEEDAKVLQYRRQQVQLTRQQMAVRRQGMVIR